MRRWRNVSQTKAQGKPPENYLNKMEISNLPDKGFKIMVIKRLTELKNG